MFSGFIFNILCIFKNPFLNGFFAKLSYGIPNFSATFSTFCLSFVFVNIYSFTPCPFNSFAHWIILSDKFLYNLLMCCLNLILVLLIYFFVIILYLYLLLFLNMHLDIITYLFPPLFIYLLYIFNLFFLCQVGDVPLIPNIRD